MLIDVHTHIVPETFPDFSRRAGGERWPVMERVDRTHCNVIIAGKNFRSVSDQCWSAQRRTVEMDESTVTRQVLSPMPMLFSYWAAPAEALDFCRYVNEVIAELVRQAPDRFYGLGMVPLQAAELAAKELAAIRKLGLNGVEIGTNVNSKSLAEPEFLPFFQEAERQRVPIFIHAQHPFGQDRFTGPGILENLIGFPQENTLAAATLITGGVIERCPHLKLLFSHGGGGFGAMLPRLDQGWRTMQQFLPKLPSQYVENYYFDTLLYDPLAIRFLLDTFGARRCTVGSDYPFVVREIPPGKHLSEVEGLAKADLEQVRYKTALEFLGLGEA